LCRDTFSHCFDRKHLKETGGRHLPDECLPLPRGDLQIQDLGAIGLQTREEELQVVDEVRREAVMERLRLFQLEVAIVVIRLCLRLWLRVLAALINGFVRAVEASGAVSKTLSQSLSDRQLQP
jgi:hypothetical protein